MVGAVVPDTVGIMEVPVYHHHGDVTLNDHPALVDRGTRKIVRVSSTARPLSRAPIASRWGRFHFRQ